MINRKSVNMDYSRATDEQLYQIAVDHQARMFYRYAAARELQNRKMMKRSEGNGSRD